MINGGLISASTNLPTSTTAPGFWTPDEARVLQPDSNNGNWKRWPEFPQDSSFSSVVFLLHADQENGQPILVNRGSAPSTLIGGTTLGSSKTVRKFSDVSYQFGVPANSSVAAWILVNTTSSTSFTMGAGDFTIEGWFYWLGSIFGTGFIDFRPSGSNGQYPTISFAISGTTPVMAYVSNNTRRITGTTAISIQTWHHAAYTRTGSVGRLFLDGNLEGSWADTTTYATASGFFLGNLSNFGTNAMNGNLDSIRVTNGVARYTSNFTVPSAPFPDY